MSEPITEEKLPLIMEKYIRKNVSSNNCWDWLGSITKDGYGQWVRGGGAHRALYELIRGKVPEGLELDHLCRKTSCVNPGHLEAVTHKENMRRIPRSNTCPRGHLFDDDNTYIRPNGNRKCKKCNAQRWHK